MPATRVGSVRTCVYVFNARPCDETLQERMLFVTLEGAAVISLETSYVHRFALPYYCSVGEG